MGTKTVSGILWIVFQNHYIEFSMTFQPISDRPILKADNDFMTKL